MLTFTGFLSQANTAFSGGQNAATISVSRIRSALGMDSGRYTEAEGGDDVLLLDCLGIDGLYHGCLSKPARAAYSEPDKKIPLWLQNPPPDETGLGFQPDGQMGTSAAILTMEYGLPFGRTALVAMIRTDIGRLSLYRDTMVFGLYGTYGADENFKFKKVIVPNIDEYGCMTGLREADTTDPRELKSVLAYIELCKNRIFESSVLHARDIWKGVQKNQPPAAPQIS